MKIKGPMLVIVASALLVGMLASSAHATLTWVQRPVFYALEDPGMYDPEATNNGPWEPFLPYTPGGPPATVIPVEEGTEVWVGLGNEQVPDFRKLANWGFHWDPTGPSYDQGAIAIHEVVGVYNDGTDWTSEPATSWYVDGSDHLVSILARFGPPQPEWEYMRVTVEQAGVAFLDKPHGESACYVPEPASMSLLGVALAGIVGFVRRRR